MKVNQLAHTRVLLGLSLLLCACCVVAQDREAIFRAAPRQAGAASEVAIVVEPADGQFVYSTERPAARPALRFAIGKASQTDYPIFSAEEQHELDVLRDHATESEKGFELSSAHVPVSARALPHTSGLAGGGVSRKAARSSTCEPAFKTGQAASLAWPKVIQQGEKVCVPKLEFADQPDWRDHLWCFNKGDGSVR